MKIVGIVSLTAFFVLTGCFAQKEDATTQSVSQQLNKVKVMEATELVANPNYVALESESFEVSYDNTVLFFHASYCGSCRATDQDLASADFPENMQVKKVDFDTALNLRQKYGVTNYHTFVQVDDNGDMIKKWSWSFTLADIKSQVEDQSNHTSQMDTQQESWMYTSYDESLVWFTDNTVIFFAASWCPSCVTADTNLAASDIPSWVTVLKADYDSALELRQKYSIASQHTFVSVDAEGNQLRKWVGGTTIDDIIEKL